MFKQKFTLSIFLLFVSLSANADDTIWKQSHALEKQGEYERAAAAIEPAVAANNIMKKRCGSTQNRSMQNLE